MTENTPLDTAVGLRALRAVTHALTESARIEVVLDLVVEEICRALHPSEVMILLVQDDRLLLRAGRGIEGIHLPRLALSDGTPVESWVVQHDAPLFVADVSHESRFRMFPARPIRIAALAAMPIHVGGQVAGVLEIGAEHGDGFAPYAPLLGTLADVVGLALEHAGTTQRACADAAREFLHDVRHDLRGPLTAIHGYAQLVQRRAERDGRAADAQTAAIIVEQVQRMTAMLDALRDAGQADEDRLAAEG